MQNRIENEVLDIDSSDGPVNEGIIKCNSGASSVSSICKPIKRNHHEYQRSESCSDATSPSSARHVNVTDDENGCRSRPLTTAGNVPVVIDSDDDPVIDLRSSKSPSTAHSQGLPEEQSLNDNSNAHDTEPLVVVCPDNILYGSPGCLSLFSQSHLEFSPECIKLETSSFSQTARPCTFKWTVSTIDKIQSMWIDSMKTAALELHLKSETQSTSDDRVLSFDVYSPDWFGIQERIQSLNIIYKDKWRTACSENTSELSMGKKLFSPSSNCCPIFGESFQEVIYPKGDPDAISISKTDVDRLQPETFINDTIIDFYILYLKNNIRSEEEHRFHFFNCFFFRKLIDLDKDPSQASEGRAAFHRVRRWTMKVDIFKKDYIFVPINFSYHWSLIVICHPGEVAGYRDGDMEKSSRVPCILHMDSLRGSHKGLMDLFQGYLWEEWKERHGDLGEDVRRKFLDLQFVHLELPQQENMFDCGLFLLHYVELFLKQAPLNFSPLSIRESHKFLSKDWFQPKDVSRKRDHIRKLIYEIFKHNQDDCTGVYDDNYSLTSLNQEISEFIKELCTESSQFSDLHSSAEAEASIMSPPLTHIKSMKFTGVSDLVSGQKLTSHGREIMSPIEEEEEVAEDFMDFPPTPREGRQPTEHLTLFPVNENVELPFGTKTGGSSMSPRIFPEKAEVQSSSDSGEEFTDLVVLDSPDESDISVDTSVFCNPEFDPMELDAYSSRSFEQKEEQRAITGEESLEYIEDSQDENDISTNHIRPFAAQLKEQAAITSEEFSDCIVLDSQDENDPCDDIHDTAEQSFQQNTNTVNHNQSFVQREEAAKSPSHLPEIFEVSEDEFFTSNAQLSGCVVEDSEEEYEGCISCGKPFSRRKQSSRKTHLRQPINDLSKDLHSKQFFNLD